MSFPVFVDDTKHGEKKKLVYVRLELTTFCV